MHFVGLKARELMVPLLHLRLQHRQVGCQVGQQDLPHRLVPQGNETHHSTCRQSKLLLKAACDVAGPFVEASVVAPVSSLAMELAMPKSLSAPLKEQQGVTDPDVKHQSAWQQLSQAQTDLQPLTLRRHPEHAHIACKLLVVKRLDVQARASTALPALQDWGSLKTGSLSRPVLM